MTQRGKMIDSNTHQGDAGIALIHRRVSQMKHVWHERQIDAGIDGAIELRDPATGEMANKHILVQSKTSLKFPGETDTKFHYVCNDRDVDYWLKAEEEPVILVCSHPETGEAWWVHVQSWFADPAHRSSLRVDFDKSTQRFDKTLATRLLALADPHGRAHTPAAVPRVETLVSNLIPVEFPDAYYTAQVPGGTTRGTVYRSQRDSKHPHREDFVLKNGRLYTWAPISGSSLSRIATTASNETPVGELIGGNEDDRRLFAQLLGAALQHDLRDLCRWSGVRKFLHVRPTKDLSELKLASASGRKRIAFKGFYQRADDPTRKQFYRHAAIRANFVEITGNWFVQFNPDYLFTSNGYEESPFADEYLSGIKKRERNLAVLGETQLWAGILKGETEPTLYDDDDRILTFGDLVTFVADRGIDDKDWDAPGSEPDNPNQMAFDFGEDDL